MQAGAERAVREPGHPDPPAPQGQVLAQPGGDDGAFRGEVHRAGHGGLGGEHEITVDLIGDDDQVVLGSDLGQGRRGGGAGEPAGGVVGQGHDHRPDPAAGRSGGRDRAGEQDRVADAALTGRDRHEMRPGTGQCGLGGIAHPARLGHGDIRPDGEQQAEQQRLAARPGDHRRRGGRQAAPGPVARGGRAQCREPGHGTVGVAVRRGGQRRPQQGVHRQAGLAEGQREDGLARLPFADEDLVRGQGGRHRDGGHDPAQAERSIGQLMHRGPPRPRPSSPPGTVITSMPLSSR